MVSAALRRDTEVAGKLPPKALQPHPVRAPSSFSPWFCWNLFLGGHVPWLDCVSTGSSRARETWAWSPPFQSFFAPIGWRSICSKNFFKNQQKQDPEKRPSLGEKELLCSLKLPSLELVGGAVPREVEGEHQGGVQLVLQAPQ